MPYEWLRTEAEYQAALARLDQVTGARPGSAMGDELQALLEQIAAYEDAHCPDD